MISVYNNMFLAVVNSMLVSLLVASSPSLMAVLFGTALKWVVIFAPLVMIFAMTWIMDKATYGQCRSDKKHLG
jgi:FtsH-binding integral membrane protein